MVHQSLSAYWDALIMTAFPQYKLEDIERMSQDTYVYLVALAEAACHNIRGIPIRILPPELEALLESQAPRQPQGQPQVSHHAGEPLSSVPHRPDVP